MVEKSDELSFRDSALELVGLNHADDDQFDAGAKLRVDERDSVDWDRGSRADSAAGNEGATYGARGRLDQGR